MSEFMLFFSCFWLLVNFRFVSNTSSIFIPSPLLSSYSFSIARSNALILQLSSLPIQPTQLYIKSADWIHAIESIGQGIFRPLRFINLQFGEMLYSYFPLSPNIIGSIFYLTTGLHGLHVIIGSIAFFILFIWVFDHQSILGGIAIFNFIYSVIVNVKGIAIIMCSFFIISSI